MKINKESTERAFAKGSDTAFLVMSPFQLLCALEAIETFDIKNFYLEFVFVKEYKHRNEQMIQMAKQMQIDYAISYTDDISIDSLYQQNATIPSKASYLYSRVFIGDYNSKHLHVEAFRLAQEGGCILYLDDGTSTICLLKGIFNNGDTNSWVEKYKAFKYKRGTNKLHRLIQEKMRKNGVDLFDGFYTMYDEVSNTKYHLYPNNFDRLRNTKQRIMSDNYLVCIIGTAIAEFSESVLRENEEVLESIIWNKLSKIKRKYPTCKIIYVPHPRDNNSVVPNFCKILNIEYLKINESVESFLLKSPCRIKAIWGFGSTALGVLRKLFKDTEIVNISISKGTTTKIYDVIYQYYSIIGIELEEVKLLDSEGETNTLLNFIRNIKDFSSFVLNKITNH